MKVVAAIGEMRGLGRGWRREGTPIAFVPTMGSLHEGHLSLVREARRRGGATVVSIFVNPAQFGPAEDYQAYPRDLARDAALLEKEGVDVLFHPGVGDMYPEGYRTYVEVHGLQDKLCGASRPGHFRGVSTVVLKLFDIVQPDAAFFGWKDAQQIVVIKRMVRDLDYPIEIVACPLVREPDGLAMSSRNSYLSPEERKAALVLSRGLREAERLIAAGERDAVAVVAAVRETVAAERLARIDYVCAVDLGELEPLPRLHGNVLVAMAVFIGKTRLIDNLRVTIPGETP